MSNVHGVGTRTPSSVQEKRLAMLVTVQYAIQVAVGKEEATAEPAVRAVSSQCFKPQEGGCINEFSIPFSIAY
jgi:hypothetical protein